MSTPNTILTVGFVQSPVFIWSNRFNSQIATCTDSGSGSTLLAGMLIGRISATGKVKQSITTATDGSQVPIGVMMVDTTFTAGQSIDIEYCISGDVNGSLLVFGGSPTDSLTSKVYMNDGTTVRFGQVTDALNAIGIIPVKTNEMTYSDPTA